MLSMMKLLNSLLVIFLFLSCSGERIENANTLENEVTSVSNEENYPSAEEEWEAAVQEKEFTNHDDIQYFFDNEMSDQQVLVLATVQKVLSDDTEGSQHQRFILELDNGQTVLVAHNIDLAPRVPNLQDGDEVEVFGEYEWNNKGGVVHWTHHDPDGDHIDGYVSLNGQVFQ